MAACPWPSAAWRTLLLVQLVLVQALEPHAAAGPPAPGPACASLQSRQSHSTVRVKVGTPPQELDVVVDTGSDDLIVESCLCQETGSCGRQDKCFRGAGSSTFRPPHTDGAGEVVVLESTFGSGTIDSVIAEDVVSIGRDSVVMQEGLLLMVAHELDFDGPFEGILGLGLPQAEAPAGGGNDLLAKSFVDQGGIPRFSVCFNEGGADGVLRLSPPPPGSPLHGSIGRSHWGLDLRGVSVGGAAVGGASNSSDALFCGPSEKREGQVTACGAVPDSGTTVMMGPAEHLSKLFSGICERWSRCSDAAAQAPHASKSETFMSLLDSCSDWASGGDVSEMPPLHFTVAGSDGVEQRLELPAASYVMRGKAQEVEHHYKYLFGILTVDLLAPTGRQVDICTPAFGVTEYNTVLNGQIWILGTPIFYAYQVHYDVASQPPSVSFSDAPCGGCSEGADEDSPTASFLLRKAARAARRSRPRVARRHPGVLRVPRLDTSKPL